VMYRPSDMVSALSVVPSTMSGQCRTHRLCCQSLFHQTAASVIFDMSGEGASESSAETAAEQDRRIPIS